MSTHSEQIQFVVVQCPPYGDAEFASRWLAAAVDADRILTRHRSANPDFETATENLGLITAVDFSSAALAFICCWQDSWPAFSLNLFESEWYEAFAYMAGTGFFTRTDQHYQMTQPPTLTSETIARALLQLAATEDENDYLHPEWLLTTVTDEDARRKVLMIEHREQARCTFPYKDTAH
jgi:hypothetical protein